MSDVTAHCRFLKMSPRKVRLVVDLVRGQNALTALDSLKIIKRLARVPVEKVIRSAIANAENNFHLQREFLRISKITVDEGPRVKRWRPRAFGRAAPIKKRTCHITVVLSDSGAPSKKVKTAKTAAAHAKKF